MSRSRVSYVSLKKRCVSSSITGMSRPSSATMCTSTDDCFCQEQVRHRRSPYSAWAQRRMSSADIASKSTSGSGSALVREQHLPHRVAPEPQAERLERDHLVRRDVPEVDVRAELLHKPGLARLRGGLEDQLAHLDLVDDLVDEAGAHLARRAVDAGGFAPPALGDHLPGAGLPLPLDPLDPLVGRVDDLRVLRAHLGEDGEVAGEVVDQLELALARDLERAVGDLDVREALLDQPALELVELPAREDGLEQRAAAHDRCLEVAVQGDLLLEVVGDVRGAPAELDDVDVAAGSVEEALDLTQIQPLVDHVRQALGARLSGTQGQV